MTSHSIPQDVITDILCWLPVKSIIRFECVSKGWSSLFKTSPFIEKHLHCSTQSRSALLLQCCINEFSTEAILLMNKITESEFHSPCFKFIVGVSKGLVCCCSLENFLFLWNPATRKYRQIPCSHFTDFENLCYGFCFNSSDNDYKIVRIFDVMGIMALPVPLFAVEVFSLRSGSWKKRNFSIDCVFDCNYNQIVTLNGLFFSMVRRNGDRFVFSIDTGSLINSMIIAPSYDERAQMKLEVYENSLALLIESFIDSDRFVDLWVFDNSCNGFSGNHWSKIQKIALSTISHHPLGIWKNQILFRDGQLIYGNINFNARVPSSALLCPRSFYTIFNYEESLVSLYGGKREMLTEQQFIDGLFPGPVGFFSSFISLYVKRTQLTLYYNYHHHNDDFLESLTQLFQEE